MKRGASSPLFDPTKALQGASDFQTSLHTHTTGNPTNDIETLLGIAAHMRQHRYAPVEFDTFHVATISGGGFELVKRAGKQVFVVTAFATDTCCQESANVLCFGLTTCSCKPNHHPTRLRFSRARFFNSETALWNKHGPSSRGQRTGIRLMGIAPSARRCIDMRRKIFDR